MFFAPMVYRNDVHQAKYKGAIVPSDAGACAPCLSPLASQETLDRRQSIHAQAFLAPMGNVRDVTSDAGASRDVSLSPSSLERQGRRQSTQAPSFISTMGHSRDVATPQRG